MLSRPEEAALEDVVAFVVLAVDPPGEVDEQLVEHALQEVVVRRQALDGPALGVDPPDGHGRPGLDRRVDVAEVPFVGG